MSQFDTFRFLLALIVFVMLAVAFTVFIVYSIKTSIKLIKFGAEDKKITNEYKKSNGKKYGCMSNLLYAIFSTAITAVMVVALVLSLMVQFNEGKVCTNLPIMNVVQSGSMSYINEKHGYIQPGEYDNQMEMHDLILTHVLPAEKDLKVGDVVVYEVDGAHLVHRIVAIEEPNDKHPDERHFLLQGDANEKPDRFPVRYNQMKSIYTGQRIAFVGSFVTFMQSPAGWLCVLLLLAAVVATPIAEKKVEKAKIERLKVIGVIPSDDSKADSEQAELDSMGNVVVQEETVSQEEKTEPVEQAQAEPDSIADVVEQAEIDSIADVVVQESTEETEQNDETVAVVADRFGSFGEGKTFEQKLEEADDVLAGRYAQISSMLGRIEKVRVLRGKKRENYSRGRISVAKLVIRGKTLNVYLGLNPADYVDTKYRFVDKTDSKTYAKTPMQLKLTSDRQTKWAKELIADLIAKYGWSLLDEVQPVSMANVVENNADSITDVTQEQIVVPEEVVVQETIEEQAELDSMAGVVEQAEPVSVDNVVVQESTEETEKNDETVAVVADRFGSFGEGKTFEQKLEEADDVLAGRYAQISSMLGRIEKVRVLRGKKRENYSHGRISVAKLVIRGKTLNVYLGLNPSDYVDTKYRFVDKTDSKTYEKTPMQLKLTSDRQTKWAKELIADLIAKYGWSLLDEQAQAEPVCVGDVKEQTIVEQQSVEPVAKQAEPDSMVDVAVQDEVDEQTVETTEEQKIVAEQQPVEQIAVTDNLLKSKSKGSRKSRKVAGKKFED